jgi:hypothetical protein
MYLAGISARRVEDITEALWGTRVSPSTVSDLNKKIYAAIVGGTGRLRGSIRMSTSMALCSSAAELARCPKPMCEKSWTLPTLRTHGVESSAVAGATKSRDRSSPNPMLRAGHL